MWLEGILLTCTNSEEGEDEDDEDEQCDGVIENQPSTQICDHVTTSTTTRYQVAKRPAFPNTSVLTLATKFGAVEFLSALSNFLRPNTSLLDIIPNEHDHFDLFKQITIRLPRN
jgi:hypothetical protein